MNKPVQAPSFLGFVSDSESHAVLRQFVKSQNWPEDRARQGSVDDVVAFLSSHPTPDFLLVEVKDAEEAPAALDKLADVCAPHVKVLVTSTVDEFSFFRWLKEIGVHHYLLKPLTVEALADALQQPIGTKVDNAPREGEVIAVIGTRGGVGASTLALNLAAAFSDVRGLNTGLLDLEPQWGTISLMLDLEPGRGLRDALAKPDRVDSLFMERVMLKYGQGLTVLSSEEPLEEIVNIHPDAASALLRESRRKFELTVVDLPHATNGFTQDFLKAAAQVVIATELSLVSLRDAMRLQDYLKGKLGLKHLHFVASRAGMLPKLEMPPAEFEKSLGVKLAAVIPFDADCYSKMVSGTLCVSKKANTPLSRAVVGLADKLRKPAASPDEKGKTGKKLGWLSGKK